MIVRGYNFDRLHLLYTFELHACARSGQRPSLLCLTSCCLKRLGTNRSYSDGLCGYVHPGWSDGCPSMVRDQALRPGGSRMHVRHQKGLLSGRNISGRITLLQILFWGIAKNRNRRFQKTLWNQSSRYLEAKSDFERSVSPIGRWTMGWSTTDNGMVDNWMVGKRRVLGPAQVGNRATKLP